MFSVSSYEGCTLTSEGMDTISFSAMTTSKWDLLEQEKQAANDEEDVDGK